MRQQTRPLKEPAEKVVQDIRRATRKHYSASIAELCRREGIAQNLYYRWSKDFLDGSGRHLARERHNRSPRFQLRSRPASILR